MNAGGRKEQEGRGDSPCCFYTSGVSAKLLQDIRPLVRKIDQEGSGEEGSNQKRSGVDDG